MIFRAVDFHSHILPGIDDGSVSVEESIAMLHKEAEQGITKVIAPPHFYAYKDNLDRFLERRSYAEQLLSKELQKHSGLPKVAVGAEVHYYSGFSHSRAISNLVIEDTKYILIEMPSAPWTEEMYHELDRIYSKQGLVPIIAHIDRYISRFRTYGIPKRLAELPVLIQANAEFFVNKGTAAMAVKMLRDDGIHLLGSDCHNLTTRMPNLGDALSIIERRLGSEAIERINQYEQRVLVDG